MWLIALALFGAASTEMPPTHSFNPSNAIDIGVAAIDMRVTTQLAVFVPVSGDQNQNASAYMEYRTAGGGSFTTGPELFYIGTDNAPISTRGFAGGLHDLTPDTAYDLRIVIEDPDGTVGEPSTQLLLSQSTRAVPPLASAQATDCAVTDLATLQSCLAGIPDMNTHPDHYVIRVAANTTIVLPEDTYVRCTNCSDAKRVMVVGVDRNTSVIDGAADHTFWLYDGDYMHLEDMTLRNSDPSIEMVRTHGRSGDRVTEGKVVRGNIFQNIQSKALSAVQDQEWVYISDNLFKGPRPQGVDDDGGGDRAIFYAGHDIEIANNTIQGFVDGIAANSSYNIRPSYGVSVHHNLILYGSDDGVECDFSTRNTFIHHNSFNNVPSAISFQPVIDGPCYAFNNLAHNVTRGPWKIKSATYNSFGSLIYHNTVIGGSVAWRNAFTISAYNKILNNLYATQSDLLLDGRDSDTLTLLTGPVTNTEIDYSAYFQDKQFLDTALGDQAGLGLAAFKADDPTGIEQNAITLNGNPFENVTLNWDAVPWTTCRDLLAPGDIEPTATTNALNAAKDIPYYNSGSADIGALQRGEVFPAVGAGWHTPDACP